MNGSRELRFAGVGIRVSVMLKGHLIRYPHLSASLDQLLASDVRVRNAETPPNWRSPAFRLDDRRAPQSQRARRACAWTATSTGPAHRATETALRFASSALCTGLRSAKKNRANFAFCFHSQGHAFDGVGDGRDPAQAVFITS